MARPQYCLGLAICVKDDAIAGHHDRRDLTALKSVEPDLTLNVRRSQLVPNLYRPKQKLEFLLHTEPKWVMKCRMDGREVTKLCF